MFENTFKNLDDTLRKEAGCATELDYAEQTSWMLFLKYLDDLEEERAAEAALTRKPADTFLSSQQPDLKADYILANPQFVRSSP